MDAYLLVCELGEGSGGRDDFSKGHFGAVTSIVSGKQGRFVLSSGQDGRLHLWVQSHDLVSADEEYQKRLLKQTESELRGRHEWEG